MPFIARQLCRSQFLPRFLGDAVGEDERRQRGGGCDVEAGTMANTAKDVYWIRYRDCGSYRVTSVDWRHHEQMQILNEGVI